MSRCSPPPGEDRRELAVSAGSVPMREITKSVCTKVLLEKLSTFRRTELNLCQAVEDFFYPLFVGVFRGA